MCFPGLKLVCQQEAVRMASMGKLAQEALLELPEKMATVTIRIAKEQVVLGAVELAAAVVLEAVVRLQLRLVALRAV
jgi:hypothetical protein